MQQISLVVILETSWVVVDRNTSYLENGTSLVVEKPCQSFLIHHNTDGYASQLFLYMKGYICCFLSCSFLPAIP